MSHFVLTLLSNFKKRWEIFRASHNNRTLTHPDKVLIFREGKKRKKISHFVLKLLSNVKTKRDIIFKFLRPSQNIQTLSIHLKGSYMHKPIKYILYIDLVFLADVGDFSIPMSLALYMEVFSYIWSNLQSSQLLTTQSHNT